MIRKRKKEIQFYVYMYKDPKTNEVVYIGKGQKKRAWSHLKSTSRLGWMLQKRIREGYDPQPIISNCADEQHALNMEKFWIYFYGREDQGTGTLFNLTDRW